MTEVARFPPLPPIPAPPFTASDERQQTFERLVGRLGDQLFGSVGMVATANTTKGFHAAAVDLGRLQKMINSALVLFDMAQVRDRWDDDLRKWITGALLTWIQRCKHIHFDLEDNGIHISLQTQDDDGYYRYELDVFPGRKSAPVAAGS